MIALTTLLLGIALAQSAVPPPQYDRPYTDGELTIETVPTDEALWARCGPSLKLDDSYRGRLRACAMRWKGGDRWSGLDVPRCHVFILPDHLLITKGSDRASVLRHEIGHCNGWIHD